ncbi:MAG: shikimate kinase [Cellvibrionaceae bacterium]|jgi:shikimate kinase
MDFEEKNYNIILTGFMGTGKTTVGRLLAKKLGFEFVDTDGHIEEQYGKMVAEIFIEDGERAFRQMERDAARDLGERVGQIISTGGRMMLDPENISALAPSGLIFCLTASAEEILRRVQSEKNGLERPLIKGENPEAKIADLLADRQERYARFPLIDTQNRTPEQICTDILQQITHLDHPSASEEND